MTVETEISQLILEVNNEKLFYRQGTLESDPGFSEKKTQGLATGGRTSHIITEDVTTAVGMVKFTLPYTETTAKQVREWQANGPGGNIVRLSGRDNFVLLDASVSDRTVFKPGVDSEIPVAFEGRSEDS